MRWAFISIVALVLGVSACGGADPDLQTTKSCEQLLAEGADGTEEIELLQQCVIERDDQL